MVLKLSNMAKLYATLENSKGKTVSISDNETITATVYDGNMKAYSVTIEWCNVGDIEEPTKGAIITHREWRNQPDENRKRKVKDTGENQPICADRQCKNLSHKHSWMK